MAFMIAMLQSGSQLDNRLLIIMGVITLATLVALGLRFLVNMKEVLTAPTASLKHHGINDNFFFSLVVVFLGGLLGSFVLLFQQSQMVDGFHQFAQTTAASLAQGNSNEIYRPVAEQWALGKIDAAFRIYFINNLLFFPLLVLAKWLVIGSIAYVGARMFGGQAAYGNFLGTLAYSLFFAGIGWGCVIASVFSNFSNYSGIFAGTAAPTVDTLLIIGALLCLYALILLLIGIVQAADLTTGQMIGTLVVLLVVLGGAGAGIYYMSVPKWEAFGARVQSIDPSQPNFQFPQ